MRQMGIKRLSHKFCKHIIQMRNLLLCLLVIILMSGRSIREVLIRRAIYGHHLEGELMLVLIMM